MSDPFIPGIISSTDLKTYRDSGVGMRVGFGAKTAILVVDMCRYIVDECSPLSCRFNGRQVVESISKLLMKARPIGIPTVYTTQRGSEPYTSATGGRLVNKAIPKLSEFAQLEEPHEILEELKPESNEIVIVKPKPSAFFGTQLTSILLFHRIDTIIVTGAVTSGCIRATVDSAAALNFRVVVPIECVADRFQTSHEVSLFDMDCFLADVVPVQEVFDHLDNLDHDIYS